MTKRSLFILTLLLLTMICIPACSPSKKTGVQPPVPAPASAPGIEVEVISQPEKALVSYGEKSCGEAPVRIQVPTLGEVTLVTARQGNRDYVEKRVRILAADRVQIVFRFGQPTATLKALGLARAMVFDYSERAAFDIDKAELKPDVLPILDHQAEILSQHFKDIPVYICGHTDSFGTQMHNMALSLQRAKSVASYLETRQFPRERMRIHGFGPDYPLDTNDTAAGRALNRRTELIPPQ